MYKNTKVTFFHTLTFLIHKGIHHKRSLHPESLNVFLFEWLFLLSVSDGNSIFIQHMKAFTFVFVKTSGTGLLFTYAVSKCVSYKIHVFLWQCVSCLDFTPG